MASHIFQVFQIAEKTEQNTAYFIIFLACYFFRQNKKHFVKKQLILRG